MQRETSSKSRPTSPPNLIFHCVIAVQQLCLFYDVFTHCSLPHPGFVKPFHLIPNQLTPQNLPGSDPDDKVVENFTFDLFTDISQPAKPVPRQPISIPLPNPFGSLKRKRPEADNYGWFIPCPYPPAEPPPVHQPSARPNTTSTAPQNPASVTPAVSTSARPVVTSTARRQPFSPMFRVIRESRFIHESPG
jgi:hypothetical protein